MVYSSIHRPGRAGKEGGTPYHYILSAILALLFFAAIPLSGAFAARASWRRFRKRMMQFSLAPLLEYGSGADGPFRFFGELEAVEGDSAIWLRGQGITAKVDTDKADIYYLPAGSVAEEGRVESDRSVFAGEEPERVSWKRLSPLPEGAPVFAAGWLEPGSRPPTFAHSKDKPLILAFYDGDAASLLRRCIWSGRQRNEYWNQLSPVSIGLGVFAQILAVLTLWPRPLPVPAAAMAILAVVLPLVPLLPPGLGFLALYRLAWRRARDLRGERDVLIMQERYFAGGAEGARLPDGSPYARKALGEAEAAELLMRTKIRCPQRMDPLSLPPALFRFYGAVAPDGSIVRPADPMADFVAVPGDAAELSRKLGARAKRAAALALVLAFLAFASNFAIYYFWLVSLIA